MRGQAAESSYEIDKVQGIQLRHARPIVLADRSAISGLSSRDRRRRIATTYFKGICTRRAEREKFCKPFSEHKFSWHFNTML